MDALTVEDDDGRGAGTLASERCFNTGLIGLHTMIITMMSRGRGFRLLRAARFNTWQLCGSNIATKVGTPSYGTNNGLIWRYSASAGCLTRRCSGARSGSSSRQTQEKSVFWGIIILAATETSRPSKYGFDYEWRRLSGEIVATVSAVPTWWCTALLHHGEFDDPTRRKTYSTSWTRLWPSLGVGSIRPNDRVRHRSEAIARTTTGTIVRQRPLQWTCTIGRQRLLPCRPSPKATANGLAKDSYCCLLSHSRSTDHCRLVVPRKIYVLRKFRLTYRYARSLLARRPNSSVPEWCSRALMIQSWWWWNKDLSFLISFKVLSRDIGLILLAWRQKWHLPAVNKVGFHNISLPNNTQPMRTWTEIKITWTMTMGSRTLDSII